MTDPIGADLLEFATPYALHAMTRAEAESIERRVAAAPESVTRAFDDEVRAVRETMTVVSAATALEPPDALRERLMDAISHNAPVRRLAPQPKRWPAVVLSAAAALIVGLIVVGVGWAIRPEPTPTTADQVFAASDVHTVSSDIPAGGTATVVYSRQRDAAVLVMNNVAPPVLGTVYQLWLVGADGARSAGVMDTAKVTPSATAVLTNLGQSNTIAFTVEPGQGSPQPTTPIFAKLALA